VNGELLLHMGMPLGTAVLIALALLPFRRRAGLGRALRPVLAVLAAANLILVAYLWTRQVDFPLNLDLMEGTVLQHVQRVAAGTPIYAAPSPGFVALAYNPLYYELGAAVGSLTGVSLPMLRLLSMLAATLSALVIFVVVREKTGRVWWGFVAAGLFAAAYDVMECYFATAHSDAWFLAAALLGTLVLDRTRSRIGSMAGIAILVASFWFKQHGALFVIGGLAYLSVRDGLRSWPAWVVAALLGPGIYLLAGPSLFGPYFHYFTWEVPRQWGTELRLRSALRFAGFVALFYPVLAASSLASLARHWRRPDAWHVQLVYAIVLGAGAAMDRGSAENVFIAMGTFFILVGTIGLVEWGRAAAAAPLPQIALLLAFVTLSYDPRSVIPSPSAAGAYADLVGYLPRLGGPVYGPWQGQLPGGFVLEPAAHWVALEDLVRGPGRDAAHSPLVRHLAAPVLRHAGPSFILANQPLETRDVLAFLTDDYVLACDLGDRFSALRVLPKRYDHGWPRYLYRDRREALDVADLRRLCATS
jgi:hypothetical protein